MVKIAPLRQEDYFDDFIEKEVAKKPPQELKTEKKKVKAKSKKNLRKVFLAVSAFGIALLIVYRYAMISDMNMENIKLKKELSEINNMNAQLQLAAEKSVNLSEIEKYAEEKLGLQKPQSYQIEYINLDKEDLIDNKVVTENKNWFGKIVFNIIEFFS